MVISGHQCLSAEEIPKPIPKTRRTAHFTSHDVRQTQKDRRGAFYDPSLHVHASRHQILRNGFTIAGSKYKGIVFSLGQLLKCCCPLSSAILRATSVPSRVPHECPPLVCLLDLNLPSRHGMFCARRSSKIANHSRLLALPSGKIRKSQVNCIPCPYHFSL